MEVGTGTVLLSGHRLTPGCPFSSSCLLRTAATEAGGGNPLHQRQTSNKNTEPRQPSPEGNRGQVLLPRLPGGASGEEPACRHRRRKGRYQKQSTPSWCHLVPSGAGDPRAPQQACWPGQATASHSPALHREKSKARFQRVHLKASENQPGCKATVSGRRVCQGDSLEQLPPRPEWRPPGAWGAGWGTRGPGLRSTGRDPRRAAPRSELPRNTRAALSLVSRSCPSWPTWEKQGSAGCGR